MAKPAGEVVETPTESLPFKAVIKADEEVILERYFMSRTEAEVFIVETLRGLDAGLDGVRG
jgi:hypothetical protein